MSRIELCLEEAWRLAEGLEGSGQLCISLQLYDLVNQGFFVGGYEGHIPSLPEGLEPESPFVPLQYQIIGEFKQTPIVAGVVTTAAKHRETFRNLEALVVIGETKAAGKFLLEGQIGIVSQEVVPIAAIYENGDAVGGCYCKLQSTPVLIKLPLGKVTQFLEETPALLRTAFSNSFRIMAEVKYIRLSEADLEGVKDCFELAVTAYANTA
jgi:hypothetical protein